MNFFGNKATAQAAADFLNVSRQQGIDENEDWKFLGNGCSRTAFLHKPSQVVYKVQYWSDDKDNEYELIASVELRKFIWEAVYIPKMEAYDTSKGLVLAVEFIDAPLAQASSRTAGQKGRSELLAKGQFSDMHGMNFLISGDICIPIDMGHPRVGTPQATNFTNADNRVLNCGDGSWW